MPRRMFDALHQELDRLSFGQRRRLLASRARGLAADGGLAALAGEARSLSEREIVLFLATVARDGAIVAAGLRDENQRLRAMAASACRHVPVEHDAIAALLEDAPTEMRKRIYKLVRRSGLTELADRLFPLVRRKYGDGEAAGHLAACSPALVERELPGLAHAVPNWRVMALAHPPVVLESARTSLAEATAAGRKRWWSTEGAGVLALVDRYPEEVLALLDRYPVEGYASGLGEALAELARRDPQRLFAMLDRRRQAYARRMLDRPCLLLTVRSLPVSWLAGFLTRHEFGTDMRDVVLATLPPSSRAELFESTRDHFEKPGEPTPEATLRVLSHEARIREARRSLALPRVSQDDAIALPYTAHLPFEEAQPALLKAAGRHLAEERAVGYELLVRCAARDFGQATVGRVLGLLRRLRNEQDPVRMRAIGALSTIPARLFTAEDAQVLTEVTTDAVAARDASGATLGALGTLAVRLLAHRSEEQTLRAWALSALVQLYGDGRPPSLGRLDLTLRRGQEHEFFAAVRPWIEAGVARANYGPLFVTVRGLGRRAWRVEECQALLEAAISSRNTQAVNREAIELWLDDPAQRSRRVESVLRGDTSTVALHVVWQTLSTNRTDLLDLVLEGKGPSGKHLAKGLRWVPDHAPRVERWLPRQHARYLELLARIAGDAGAQVYRRAAAIRAAAVVPDKGFEFVERYCGSANTVLDEVALGALVWTDRPARALPLLLSHVDDDRARVAVYALGRAARFVAPSATRPIFAAMLREARKVTSRKEAIRLLSQVAPHEAMADIAPAWHADQHRDVRVAIVAAAYQHLDEPVSWGILEEATADPERAVAEQVVRAWQGQVPVAHRERYAGLVGRVCRHPDRLAAQAAMTVYPQWAPWSPGVLADLADAVCDLENLTSWRFATGSLTRLLDEGFGPAELWPVLERLNESDVDTVSDAGDARDRPARQRLLAMARGLVNWIRLRPDTPGEAREELSAIGQRLARRPENLAVGLELMVWGMPVEGDIARGLARLSALIEGRPLAAQRLAEGVLERFGQERERLVLTEVRQAAAGLAAAEGLAEGLVALSLARCAAASPSGWADERDRQLLRRLRSHAHPDVRDQALSVFTQAE